MPKINDYGETTVSQQASPQQSYSSLVNTGEEAAITRQTGASFEQAYNIAYQKTSQGEVSDLNSRFAEARADWSNKIAQQTKDGTIDVTKIRDEYQDYIDKMGEGIQTSEGQNFFNRQSGRLAGFITKNAAHGQSVALGVKAHADWQNGLDKNSSALQNDPSSFQDIYGATVDGVDAQVQTGALSAKDGEQLKHESGVELAKNAVRGWANLDPETARKKLDSGEFDQFFNGDVKSQMKGYINQVENAKEIEERRGQMAQEKAQKAQGEAWEQSAIPDLAKGTLNTKAIIDSPMTAEKKIQWLRLADESAKKQMDTNPAVYNDLVSRSLLPDDDPRKVTSITDMAPYINKGVSIQDAEKINGFIQKTPDGENLRDNRKRLMDLAKAKLLGKESMTGIADPDGQYNMLQFQVALQNAEKQAQVDKVPLAELYNPNSKHFYGNQIDKYQSSPQEILQKMANNARGGTVHSPGLPPPDKGEMVRVKAPNGQTGKVNKNDLEAYKKQGYTEI